MLKNTLFLIFALTLVLAFNANLHSQQCEVITNNINFESDNSLTFDVVIKNSGTSSFVYSNGSFAWTYDTAILNGGTPTFSLVPGYSDFPSDAYPPSALVTGPNILRTSSNIPGSNGVIEVDERLLLYRFRLQTTASSFSSENFEIVWKNSVAPFTRIFSWDAGSGLPTEVENLEFSVLALLLVDNFEFTGLLTDNGWTAHSGGTTNAIETTTGLNYTDYPGSGVGNAALLDATGQDVNRTFTAQTTGYVYYSALVNVTAVSTGYFLHLGGGGYASRVFVKPSSTSGKINFGISNSSTSVYGTTDFDVSTTYLVIVKYEVANPGTNNLWVLASGVPATEIAAGTPEVTTGLAPGQTTISSINLRQYSSSQNITVDGIRIGTDWADIFPAPGTPTITVAPSTLSGFTYFVGGGPSASQFYDLSGSDLTPASGDITVTGSTNYEVSSDDANFGSGFTVGYSGGTLNATPIYVRLKTGLLGGTYDGDITNEGGGATTQNVTCYGAVVNPEPTNHATNFTGVLGFPSYYWIDLSWTDATGGTEPDGYLIKRSSVDFSSIVDPVDGVTEFNTDSVLNVDQGVGDTVFSGSASTTYYFKIFPFTNSGSDINYKTDETVPEFNITTGDLPALPFVENFDYTAGDTLTNNGWINHSGSGNLLTVTSGSLTYTGYQGSGIGNSTTLNGGSGSREDIHASFSPTGSGALYVGMLVNVATASTTGEYFFSLAPVFPTYYFKPRLRVKDDGSGNLLFGISKTSGSTVSYTTTTYLYNTTYLLVVKYDMPAGDSNDVASVYINPGFDSEPVTADIVSTDFTVPDDPIAAVCLRQGYNAYSVQADGIIIGTSWNSIFPSTTTFSFSIDVYPDKWNMLSVPGTNTAGMGVETWWPDYIPNVWGFDGTVYVNTDTATTGEGYWMKHGGVDTMYYYTDIEIVSHDPIPVHKGWNMMGVYEYSVAESAITTDPIDTMRTGTIWGFDGTVYVNMASGTLEPGYGYWIRLLDSCNIVLPAYPLAKGSGEVVEYFKEDWGRIVMTDAAGISYTLYAVNGEVDLDQYEMPPALSGEMFDIRFSSGRVAEDISSSIQSIDMTGITYPLTVRVEGMDIRLQDETGNQINENIMSGEEITISNTSINKLMVSGSGEMIPDVYALEQNYPNPFNPSTVIEFSLPEDVSNVQLTIYDILGQKITQLVNTSLKAGYYNYQWDAGTVSTGMYIYELRTDKFVSVKKMLLLK